MSLGIMLHSKMAVVGSPSRLMAPLVPVLARFSTLGLAFYLLNRFYISGLLVTTKIYVLLLHQVLLCHSGH